jgi:hypothetical protein
MIRNILAYEKQKGQILILSALFLGLFSSLLVGLFQVSFAVQKKIRLQISADAAILSALNCEANALNTIALTNRAVLANDALAAQLNSLVSESSFYQKLAERFSRLLRFIPYAGPVSLFLSKGAKTLETIFRRTTSEVLPFADLSNTSLTAARKGIRQLFPLYTLKAAQRTLAMNMPQAELTSLSHGALIRQTRSLQNNLSNLGRQDIEKMRMETMDRHTKKRNWRISIAGISPIKKSGGTRLDNGNLVAQDKMRMKVFSRLRVRWKTVLSTRSRANDFGYHPPNDLTTLLKGKERPLLSLGITVQSDLPDVSMDLPLGKQKLTAISAATLVYRRESRPDEAPDTFNPFWTTRLIPVASEPTLKKAFPEFILKEVRH